MANEVKIFLPVDVQERLPNKTGWYNLTSNATPAPCGRAYFNGQKFNLNSPSAAAGGVLESGQKLYWLEERTAILTQ